MAKTEMEISCPCFPYQYIHPQYKKSRGVACAVQPEVCGCNCDRCYPIRTDIKMTSTYAHLERGGECRGGYQQRNHDGVSWDTCYPLRNVCSCQSAYAEYDKVMTQKKNVTHMSKQLDKMTSRVQTSITTLESLSMPISRSPAYTQAAAVLAGNVDESCEAFERMHEIASTTPEDVIIPLTVSSLMEIKMPPAPTEVSIEKIRQAAHFIKLAKACLDDVFVFDAPNDHVQRLPPRHSSPISDDLVIDNNCATHAAPTV